MLSTRELLRVDNILALELYPLSYSSIGSSASYTILTNLFISLLSSSTTANIRSVAIFL